MSEPPSPKRRKKSGAQFRADRNRRDMAKAAAGHRSILSFCR